MGKISTGFSMSLDGYVAGPNDEVDRVFQWMGQGDKDYVTTIGGQQFTLKMSDESIKMRDEQMQMIGVLVAGRHLFDISGAWGGRHPMNVPIVVLTHHPPQEWVDKEGSPFTFVTDGFESALTAAQKIAGEKYVALASPPLVQQAMNLGLLDEIHVDLVHVVLGKGKPLFANLNIEPTNLKLTRLIQAPGVTHMTFDVVK